MKRPWLAALLNVFPVPMGLGYLYMGRPGRFGLAFLGTVGASGAGIGLLVLAIFTAIADSDSAANTLPIRAPVPLLLILAPVPLLLLAGLTAWNAYSLADRTAGGQGISWREAGKSVLALILVGVPVTLGVQLLYPSDHWRGPPFTKRMFYKS